MANKPNQFLALSQARKNEQEALISKATNQTPNAKPKKSTGEKTRKPGRPCKDEDKGKKEDYCKTINIAVPKEDLEKVNEYALKGRALNLTEYINLLIANDLEKNLAKYKREIKRTVDFD